MKTKRILSVLILMIVSCCFVCLGCDKGKNPPTNPPPADIVVEGVKVESIEILQFGESFECLMLVRNEGQEDVEIDASEFVFKINNTVLEHDGVGETISANSSAEFVFLIEAGNSGVRENSKVSVYFKGEFLKTVNVQGE